VPWDVACFPRGREGAHQIRNDTHARPNPDVLDRGPPDRDGLPDSAKFGISVGDREVDMTVRRSSKVPCYDGET
jgi:hypothetical protein